ncbi:tetratricopeptide repeat-containing sensor histidine kinase [Bacteroides stercoris]|uniref:tetratricopeptide repeat-containing sensor histidine kinase n=1 Tax=Bacteroides stercoris TaxID=46506 RepID=UPI0012699A54|nr:tetratricopeptide repeat-containing sensor histidine kinase [Bacteroides stercoris]KAB5268851.1 tetratricopeptide repeat protein [Bacteroides stercoris]
MKTLFVLLGMFVIYPCLYAQDAELQACREELARGMSQKNRDSIAAAYCHLGEYYAYRQADSTRYYCEQGLKYAATDKAEPYLYLLNNLADAYFSSGQLDESLKRFRFVLEEAGRLHWDEVEIASVLSSVGVIYRRKEMPDSALVCYNRALALLDNREAYDERTQLLTSIAILYTNTARLKEGEYYIRKALEASEKSDDMDMVMYAAATAGSIFTLRENYAEAAQLLYPVLAKAREQQKPRFVLKIIAYLLSAYYRLDNRDSINHYMAEGDKVAAGLPATNAEVQGYHESLCDILTKMGRYGESLHKAEVETELSELSIKYENQEKELEIARLTQQHLEQKAKTMQWSVAAVVAFSAFLLLAAYYVFQRKRIRKEEELKLAQSYIDGLERERTRLAKDLHDGVCNDLLGIGMNMQYMQPTDESKREILALLEQVRSDVRCISHELMPPKFQVTTLAETVEAYVEGLALPASVQLAFSKENEEIQWSQVPEEVSYEVYRIMQELLSNILKHSGATEIDVTLTLKRKLLTLQISNNGKNYCGGEVRGKGIGLTTIQERAKAVGGLFTTDIQDGSQKFRLEISLSI